MCTERGSTHLRARVIAVSVLRGQKASAVTGDGPLTRRGVAVRMRGAGSENAGLCALRWHPAEGHNRSKRTDLEWDYTVRGAVALAPGSCAGYEEGVRTPTPPGGGLLDLCP